MNPICIYHRSDLDGVCSGAVGIKVRRDSFVTTRHYHKQKGCGNEDGSRDKNRANEVGEV